MIPTIGRIVHYRLSADDADQINRRRTSGSEIAKRITAIPQEWPLGAQAHIGNKAEEGQTFPAIIVRTWGETEHSAVQLQVFLDGNDTFWATSVIVGEGPRTYSWPTRS